jgi:AhpD family alkylhydroperoxidase
MAYGKEVQDGLREPYHSLRAALPEVFRAYGELSRSVMSAGALDVKTKELIALAISVSKQCDGCIASHAKGAARSGATAEEVAEALAVTISMNGGPGTVYAPRAFEAFREFAGLLDERSG